MPEWPPWSDPPTDAHTAVDDALSAWLPVGPAATARRPLFDGEADAPDSAARAHRLWQWLLAGRQGPLLPSAGDRARLEAAGVDWKTYVKEQVEKFDNPMKASESET